MKLSKLITRFMLLIAFSSVLLGLVVSIFFQYSAFKTDLYHFKDEFTQQKKKEVRNEVLVLYGLVEYKENLLKKTLEDKLKARVNQAYSLAMSIYETNKNKKSENEIKLLIAQNLKNLNFKDDDNYFFINSNKGQAILYNKEIKLDNYEDIWNLKGVDGKFIIQEQSKIALEQNEGYLINTFVKPNSNNNNEYSKLSYIKLFEPYNWHIGMGEYLDVLIEKNKQELLDWISSLKHEDNSYFFINSVDGNTLIYQGNKLDNPKPHPYPELFKKQLQISNNPNGDFFEYEFTEQSNSQKVAKVSFVKQFKEYGWIIGSGVHLDKIAEELKRKEELFKENIKNQFILIFVKFFIILIVIYFLAAKMSSFINNNINNLIQAFKKASKENKKIDTNSLTYEEFVLLTNDLNKVLENRNMIEKELQEHIKIVNQNVIISSTDTKGIITDVSEAFCEISGYKKEELIGNTHKIIRHPDTPYSLYKEMKETLLSGKEWRGEIKNRDKNLETYWVSAVITPIIKDNQIKGFTGIRTNITDKKYIEELSVTDELTKLYNRRFFNIKIEEEINRAKREDKYLCLMILDIDYFKQYNDTYGHLKGDTALKQVANAIKNRTNRASDFVFRVGGEEFAIIATLENDNIIEFAKKIKEDVENMKIEHKASNISSHITVSIGVSCKLAKKITNSDEIYKEADDNLYKAKDFGRNCVYM